VYADNLHHIFIFAYFDAPNNILDISRYVYISNCLSKGLCASSADETDNTIPFGIAFLISAKHFLENSSLKSSSVSNSFKSYTLFANIFAICVAAAAVILILSGPIDFKAGISEYFLFIVPSDRP
jgi:hypothetical protein